MSLQRYRELMLKAEAGADYWREIAVSDFARELTHLMQARKIKNSELARRMGVQRQYITKLLNGTNATLGSMVKVALALDAVVRIRLEAKESRENLFQRDPPQDRAGISACSKKAAHKH